MRGGLRAPAARTAALFVGGVVLAAACTSAAGSSSDQGLPRATLGLSPIEASSTLVATSPATTRPPTSASVAPTAKPTSTTKAPVTTVKAPSASLTTAPPPTLTPTTVAYVPKGFAVVADMTAMPFAAVGTSNGDDTKRVQARLLELGFWLSAVDGQYGLATTQAVMAYQKYVGLPASGAVDADTARSLTAVRFRASGSVTDGTMVEIDKRKQLLFLVENGRTLWVFNTSTGSGKHYIEFNKGTGRMEEDDAITPDGIWTITRERPAGWWDGDLGKIYRPKYFHGGIAIHGMNNVPNRPVSHGCVRLSLPAMDFIWNNGLVPKGSTVWVHGGEPA